MESNHVKSINTDERSNKRIKFASAKQRSKLASADVYRSHKRKIGATSASTREEAVHNPHREINARKRQRSRLLPVAGDDHSKAAVLKLSIHGRDEVATEAESLMEAVELETTSSLAGELDETADRNASEIFGKFHRQMWPLVRSLPEILHHAKKIVDLMLSHMLSPESSPERPSDLEAADDPSRAPRGYVVNHATLDILHLLAVLARDLRHEIHPFLHTILQRITQDLLYPPPPPPESGKQPIPLDVTLVEASFRCMSYIFRYDADKILQEVESMRKYYGATIAARRELVRRLASETFAPLIRKLKSQNERQRHLKLVLKALSAATKGQPVTPHLKRTQEDAVDGISHFLFQIVRGVPGRLHSQGSPTLLFVLSYCTRSASAGGDTEGNQEGNLLLSVASSFLDRLCRHIDQATTQSLNGMLVGVLKSSLAPESRKKSGFEPALNALRLFAKVAATGNRAAMTNDNPEPIAQFYDCLDSLFGQECFPTFALQVREEMMSLLCPILLSRQEDRRLGKSLVSWLPVIFDAGDKGEKMSQEYGLSVRNMTAILSRDLIPYLENRDILENLGSITLSAAARVAEFDKASALLTIYALATKQYHEESQSPSTGLLFFNGAGTGCIVSGAVQQELMETCLQKFDKSTWDQTTVERLAVALRCVPFVASIPCDDGQEARKKGSFEQAAKWYSDVLSTVDKATSKTGNAPDLQDIVLIKALCLEGFGHLATVFLANSVNTSVVLKTIRRLLGHAENLLFSHPGSLWAIRGVAAFVNLLGGVKMVLNDKADEIFDALVPNLSSPSHDLRLHTLEILATYPVKNFVVDHADLDLEGDLDEEPSYGPKMEGGGKRQGPVGKCEIISTLLEIERMKVQLTRERPLLGLVSRVEVLGRSGKLPAIYAEAAAHHMLGLFYVKFAPLWPVASRALVALAEGHENDVWPALEAKLVSVVKLPSVSEVDLDAFEEDAKVWGYHQHRIACIQWEASQGRLISIFGELPEMQDGEVYRHLTTDEATVMQSIWEVAEKCQQLVARHSQVIVHTFLGFLTEQYFFYHSDDPIARELQLAEGLSSSVDRSLLHTHDLQKRLICFLRVFAAVEGPQQLAQHKFLEKIFRSFLTHQETEVVQLSLACLLKFKPKYLVPYREQLTGILEKGSLRSALLNFQEAIEAGKVAMDHRKLLVPVISRILFGRLSVRESRSRKDSPAARRNSILSFVAIVCQEDDEVFSFVYLMTRCFVPRGKVLKEIEGFNSGDRREILALLDNVDAEKLNLRSGVIEGFLHLLEAVFAQLGHRIKVYIPTLTSIVLALCRVAAVAEVADDVDGGLEIHTNENKVSNDGLRRGAIRTLCFQRLSEMFAMYSSAVEFASFGDRLWDTIRTSVALLPEMVIKSDRVPALLHMLETLSSNTSLLQVLCMDNGAVTSIIKCIASTSFTAVMNSVLTIIENLLDAAIANPESKSRVIVGYVPSLMEQFALRFQSSDEPQITSEPKPFHRNKPKLRQATWRRELRILCRVSELLEQGEWSGLGVNGHIMEGLSELLLPFLEPDSGTSDEDKLNVLGVLRSTLIRVQPGTLEIVYGTLSDILGPNKGKPGIESISVRNEVARLVAVIGEQQRDLREVAAKVAKLSAVHSKRVDEVDFETVIPELNALGKDGDGCEWEVLAADFPLNLAPVVSICFHYLHNEDGVLSRASFNALKSLVCLASKNSETCQSWIKLVESLVVPPTRSGLQARNVSIRRYYILIVRETAKSFKGHDSPNLYGDLSALIDEDNPDLDFFVGVTHVQMHRRGRALQRLRKTLRDRTEDSAGFTSQSLSGFLLPLALHPAYESKMKVEETFALEGIATVGAIARYLPWNKYHNTIWSILSSFDRHPDQERYLVGTLCAIIDAFNFDLVDKSTGSDGDGHNEKTSVWRALERRTIPKLEGLLVKEKSDKSGKKSRIIRPPVVLALVKLFQKFPTDFFESKLPNILAVMCDALRSKDSDARDLARTTMAKIVTGMDLKYLADVVRELTITLNEGYKLHVRAATIHTILQELLTIHQPPEPGIPSDLPASSFDLSIPALMDILQEDLFGEANDRRESQDTNVRYVKEAGGSKSVHSIEILCRMLRFQPSDAAKTGGVSKSSVHCVVSPLLERLCLFDVNASTIRKIKEILVRVVIGLSHNESVSAEELFPFVYATIQPFIGSQTLRAVLDDDQDDIDQSLQVSGSRSGTKKTSEGKSGKVVEWRPSTINYAQSSRAAKACQLKERQDLRRVMDGASAPKLTGTARKGTLDDSDMRNLNDPATISAVVFGLSLLNTFLKKLNLNEDEKKLISLMDPFVPMLTACICNCKDNDVALVAMKCLMSCLRFNLPSLSKCSKSLGTQALTFLSSSGSSLNQSNDMTQACFRTLTYLINRDRTSDDHTGQSPMVAGAVGEEALATNSSMPLNGEQMRVLLSFLSVSITESEQHNPALSLIKAILSRKFMSPEFYDLMVSVLKLNVRSQKASLRQQSGGIFIRYLLDYPMGEDLFEAHLKQIVANISYEYQDGRLSAIQMLTAVVEKLPDELLERHAQLLFLPQVLQLVNDDSKECREAVSKCLSTLLARSALEVLQSFHTYTIRWCCGKGPMQVASLQVLGIFVDTCRGFVQSNDYTARWIDRLKTLLKSPVASDWEVNYFCLICLEKLAKLDESGRPLLLSGGDTDLWNSIVEHLIDSHPWIKLVSCRIVHTLLISTTLEIPKVLQETPGMLFDIIRNVCAQLNVDEEEQSEESSEQAIKTLTLALPLVKQRPDLCFTTESPHAGLRDPIAWILRRLSSIAKPKGHQRRISVYKCFAAFCSRHPDVVLTAQDGESKKRQLYMELMLEPLHRSDLEASNELDNPMVLHKATILDTALMTESSMAKDVLQLIEEGCGDSPEEFLQAYAAVKSRARDKKDERKVQAKAEAAQDPMAAALKKTKKQQQERQRKKRRVDDRRRDRGAQKKRRSYS